MSVDLKLVKQLRDRTNLGMNDCKKALEESNSDIDAAIDLLKKWGELKGAEKAHKIATEGKVNTFSNNSESVVGIIELNCQTDFLANSKEFQNLLDFSKMDNFSDEIFEQKRKELVAKTGENIVLRRKEIWNVSKNSVIKSYVHPGSRLAVLLEASCENMTQEALSFVDDCAMQIAAMSPTSVSKDDISQDIIERQHAIFEAQLKEEKKPEQAWPKIIEGKFAKWRKDTVLLEQESIKEAKKSIEQIRQELSKKLGCEIKINRFIRYALGEGLEKTQENYSEEVAKLIA